MGTLDTFPMDITCGNCGHEFKKTVAWMKSHDDFTCPSCDHFHVIDEEMRNIIASAEKSIDEFANDIDKLNR